MKHSNTYLRTTISSRLFTGAMKIFSMYTVNSGLVKKVRLRLRKLGTTEHNRFVDFILPKKTTDLIFLRLLSYSRNNSLCNDFKLAELTADDFKCLIFAQGLVSAEDAEVRRHVLTKLENEHGLTLQKLAEDCQK